MDTNIDLNDEIEYRKETAEKEGLEYLQKGRKLFLDANLSEAAECLQHAVTLLDVAEDYKNYCDALNVLSVVLVASGNDSIALDHYLDGLEIANRYNIDISSISMLNNIGSRFQQLGDNEKALEYLLKSMKLLESISIDTDPRLPIWKVVMEINICNAYRGLRKYELAKTYMERVENFDGWSNGDSNNQLFYFSYKVSQANLMWAMGEKEEVKKNLPKLVELAMLDGNVSDYVQDIADFLELLQEIGERSFWEMVLQSFEQFASRQDSLHIKIFSIENWIKFFKYYDMKDKYQEACVLYTKLMMERSEADRKERVMAMELKVTMREKEAATRKYQNMANVDALTGVGNRNKLETDSKLLLEKSIDSNKYIGIGLFDLDHFKEKNDTYGHLIGDACLRCLVRALENSVGSSKYIYRFGGDEFVVILPGATRKKLNELADKVKAALDTEQEKDEELCKLEKLTLSQGYAYGIPEKGDTFMDLLETADNALYAVKENGRDGYLVSDYTDIKEYSIH